MTVIAIAPDQPNVEIVDGRLITHDFAFDGTIVELIEELGIADDSAASGRLLHQAVEAGAAMLLHGQRRAAIDAIAAEIERLMQNTAEETGKLPVLIQKQLAEHLSSSSSPPLAAFQISGSLINGFPRTDSCVSRSARSMSPAPRALCIASSSGSPMST